MGVNSKETTLQLNKPQRNVSLDVLRVLAMFMIVMGHVLTHGGIMDHFSDTVTVNQVVVKTLNSFLHIHVNCFVLVSGYFLCTSKFKLSKWLKLWVSAFFWSVLIYTVLCLFGIIDFSFKGVLTAFLPFTQRKYWFVTTYLLMYILSPVCNVAINNMTKKQHAYSLIGFFVIYIVLQNIFFWCDFTLVNAHNPLYFVFLYFVAAYIRKYPFKRRHSWFLGYVICVGFISLYTVIEPIISKALLGYEIGDTAFSGFNSVPNVIGAICFFMTFLQANIKGIIGRIAIAISPLTFGVYLIHDHNDLRGVLWGFLKPYQYAHSPFLVPIVIIISIIVFAGCCLLEKLRIMLFSALKIYKVYDEISANVGKLVSKININ